MTTASEFVRFAYTMIATRGAELGQMSAFASTRGYTQLATHLRSAATATESTNLPYVRASAIAFVDALRNRSAFAKLLENDFVKLPLGTNVRIVSAASPATLVNERSIVPMKSLGFFSGQIAPRSASALVAVSKDFVRLGGEGVVRVIERELRAGVGDALDGSLYAVASSDAPTATLSGNTTDDAMADIRWLFSQVTLGTESRPYILLDATTAKQLATARGSNGFAFNEIGPRGGVIANTPALVSGGMPAGTMMLLDAAAFGAEIDTLEVGYSEQASIQMDTSPDSPPQATTALLSMWQQDLEAAKVFAIFGLERLRSGSVAVVTGCSYTGGADSPP